ncbi:MAG: exodeoxyribonuclease VII large subunit [Clostridia bacterium]|nr:exodeoxyribonuclease VII large subunit [Clostridia bacterium]
MAEERKILSVTQLNKFIKQLVDANPVLSNVSVSGEISNCKIHSSGHIYMSLKDEGALVRAVMFRSSASKLKFRPENGMKVIASGRISVFERDGQYQLYIDRMTPEGEGSLYLAFEQLKKKLESEGLFDKAKKRKIKRMPMRIGIVTSPTGAALRDMQNILGRRFPLCEILIYPALVQGPQAPAELIAGVNYLNEHKLCDTIIIGRGGGSIEELWAFNDEGLARAVAASEIPVISAVGHETDFTICDFAADLRAPTPSAAAELAVPNFDDIYNYLKKAQSSMSASLTAKVNFQKNTYERLAGSFVFAHPERMMQDRIMAAQHLEDKMTRAFDAALKNRIHAHDALSKKLHALDPMSVLARGYSVTTTADGRMIKSADDIEAGGDIKVYLDRVILEARTTKVKNKPGTEDEKNA